LLVVLGDSCCSGHRSRSSETIVSPGRFVRLVEGGREKTRRGGVEEEEEEEKEEEEEEEEEEDIDTAILLRGRQGWSERVRLVGIPPTLFSQGNIRARNPVRRFRHESTHALKVDDIALKNHCFEMLNICHAVGLRYMSATRIISNICVSEKLHDIHVSWKIAR